MSDACGSDSCAWTICKLFVSKIHNSSTASGGTVGDDSREMSSIMSAALCVKLDQPCNLYNR